MYYPKSQIKTNLYTNGNEYTVLSTGNIYQGFYYKISTGEYFTGRTPDDRPNLEIVPIIQPTEVTLNNVSFRYNIDVAFDSPLEYEGGFQADSTSIQIVPYYIASTPTEQDYQIGEFRRYFCKKGNEILYLEIDKTQYDLLVTKNPSILFSLYEPFNLPWQITGVQEEVEKTNRNIVALTSQRLKLPEFGRYLNNNYLKYYKFPNISNLYTSGSEFKTSDGQNYIGFYHIHDNTGPMVGKTHTKEPHGLLFPINEAIISEVTTRYNNQPMMSTTGSINVNMGTPSGGGGGY